MSDYHAEYWAEALSEALDALGKFDLFSSEELAEMGKSLAVSAECQSQAFYTPPASDRISDIEREAKVKYARLEQEFETYRGGAEKAIKRALRQYDDANVSISGDGEVFRYGGRTEQIL